MEEIDNYKEDVCNRNAMSNSYYKFGSTKNPYGLKDGRLVHVQDVEKGLKCGCICPTCKVNLIAKKGYKRIHHFAHQCDDNSCLHIQDTYFMLALEIIEQNQYITLPNYYSIKSQKVTLKNIRSNRYSNDNKILPEIIAETEDEMEIHIRYKTIKGRGRCMQSNDIVCLELNAEQITLENLRDFLLNSTDNKKWLANPFYDAIIEQNKLDSFPENDDDLNYPQTVYNHYLEYGTEQQKEIKELLHKNEYIGKTIEFCDCEFKNNCPYLIRNFFDNKKEYVICSNFDKYQSVHFKEKYFNFKPLPQFDAMEQYEAKIWYNKHFTKETIITDFVKVQNHIIVLHTDDKDKFYVTNVRYRDNKYIFSHEKEFTNYQQAENYYLWVINLESTF